MDELHLKLLGLSSYVGKMKTLTLEALHQAKRSMSRKYHPDITPNQVEKFFEVNRAAEALEKKVRMNTPGENLREAAEDSPETINRIVEEARQALRRRGEEEEGIMEVELDLEELEGLPYLIHRECTNQRGSCYACLGTGSMLYCDAAHLHDVEPCPRCRGHGRGVKAEGGMPGMRPPALVSKTCAPCQGVGYLPRKERIKCEICYANRVRRRRVAAQFARACIYSPNAMTSDGRDKLVIYWRWKRLGEGWYVYFKPVIRSFLVTTIVTWEKRQKMWAEGKPLAVDMGKGVVATFAPPEGSVCTTTQRKHPDFSFDGQGIFFYISWAGGPAKRERCADDEAQQIAEACADMLELKRRKKE